MQGGNQEPKIMVRMCGRNPDRPTDRTPGLPTEQRIEPNAQGISGCLTSVQKDNMVLEKPILLGGVGKENEFGSQFRQGNRVYSSNACAMALNSQPVGNAGGNSYLYNVGYRIRKLTPRECGRLMDVSDEDITKMQAVNSNSQLYKQFGNSIVVAVMVEMFKNLNICQGKGEDGT
jgi:site-specific DNA-cytosine methylase